MLTEIITAAFQRFLPCAWEPRPEQIDTLKRLVKFADSGGFCVCEQYEAVFAEAVNQKLGLNSGVYQEVLDEAFLEGIKLNYLLKMRIKRLLDRGDDAGYERFLAANRISSDRMRAVFRPVGRAATMRAVSERCAADPRYLDIYCSIFSRFCFNLFPESCAYGFFSGDKSGDEDYFEFIGRRYPDMTARDNALYLLDISQSLFEAGYEAGCGLALNAVKEAYDGLNNHCDLAVYIPPIEAGGADVQWRLFADVVLFAEKHRREKIDRPYFRWKKIGAQTAEYVRNLSAPRAEFEFAFQGFVFKDCFILGDDEVPYSILLIFEKNVRDERIVNCPACRSTAVQGNSYPILNVRSWECENPLCPDRSKYNRGKRYAFMSLFRQKEMLNDENVIPGGSISRWRLDCRRGASKQEALDMVVRHYSCVGDGVVVVSAVEGERSRFGRTLRYKAFCAPRTELLADFKASAYFYRFLQRDDRPPGRFDQWTSGKAAVYCGDALEVLRTLPSACISCAVTSPPYYNAKSYSQWPNIYCYLYDMYNINSEVFRVLRDGAVYLYNIFDYFDNENNIALSAMGNKRMILGAYMIDLFERIGFQVCGNIIWDKGEIQGNRSFNQGNLTPYYQAPLNCWEHILILSKGAPDVKFKPLRSAVKSIKPVIKMVRGKNVLGHDAPYPHEIPDLVIGCMEEGDVVLDPFLGSGTTCIAANRAGRHSLGIEKNEAYFDLCRRLISADLNSGVSP